MSFAEHRKILADLKRFEDEIPAMVDAMGTIAKNHFVKSFRDQGFTDLGTVEKWPRRKTEKRLFNGYVSRAILVQSGALRRSIRTQKLGRYAIAVKSDLPYAKIHNEGLRGRAFGKYQFTMPKRQFMGNSRTMEYKIGKKLDQIIKTALRTITI